MKYKSFKKLFKKEWKEFKKTMRNRKLSDQEKYDKILPTIRKFFSHI